MKKNISRYVTPPHTFQSVDTFQSMVLEHKIILFRKMKNIFYVKVVTYILYQEIMYSVGYFLWEHYFFSQYLDM